MEGVSLHNPTVTISESPPFVTDWLCMNTALFPTKLVYLNNFILSNTSDVQKVEDTSHVRRIARKSIRFSKLIC